MACSELLITQAFIDGELAGSEADAAERHIAGCARCQAFCEDAAALHDEIHGHGHGQRHAAPDGLKLRVREAIAAAATVAAPKSHSAVSSLRSAGRRVGRGVSAVFIGGFAGGIGVGGLAAAILVLAVLPPTSSGLEDRVIRAHTQALMSGSMIQVVSSDHHTVKPWFAGQIALSPPVHDFAAEGFRLAGGRIDKIGRRPAAVLVYEHGLHKIDLFVWADGGERLPDAGMRRGYHALYWKHDDLDFAAVSDMQASELAAFATLVRAAPE